MKVDSSVSLLGTGLLGLAIAERLQACGHVLSVFNRTPEKARPLQSRGVTVFERPEQAIEQSECVILVLADARAIRSVLLAPSSKQSLRGRSIVQMGTIGPDESLAIQREVEEAGGSYCEAPVLGSVAEANSGTLLVMFGGTREHFDQVNPVLRSLSHEPRFTGPVGTAAALKLALNHLIAAEVSAFGLSLGLIQRADVSVELFMSVLKESALFAPTFEKKLPRLLARQYDHPNFSTEHMMKDLTLVRQECQRAQLALDGLEGVLALFRQTLGRGIQQVDYSSVFEVITSPDRHRSR
ncbi:3-hydroxyacid dehydrogenase [Nitrospira sp. KM1]|uniref:NAD(P)-dependent oxidoreductase n=1 Tax=Nitrospira sp. KM1 TaxID=1936990 RepID=UPI0013A79A16|nr:NAD(P)-dependent oxidoreductase [Nitrospira sp. KM1]BCA55200.1 3-hydroxyacid dehydrogenase [Nitrospira sp. KM1]